VTQTDREWRIERMREQLARLEATPEPVDVCAVCGTPKEQTEWGLLTDVTVVTADGQEGYSNVTLLLCDEHFRDIADGLIALGFVDHRHGSTSTLEDSSCPGYEDMEACLTPTRYGNVTWGRTPPQDPEEE
jgi:hypothetical protein